MEDYSDFYTKQISLCIHNEGIMAEGRYQKGTQQIKTIDCDVQPTSHSHVEEEYGAIIESQYTVFCDVDTDIKSGMAVIFDDNEYTIIRLKDWDDYYILYLKAVQ